MTSAQASGSVTSTLIIPPVIPLSVTPSFNAIVKSTVHVTWSNERTILLSSELSFPGSSSASHGPVPVFVWIICADDI